MKNKQFATKGVKKQGGEGNLSSWPDRIVLNSGTNSVYLEMAAWIIMEKILRLSLSSRVKRVVID